MLLVKTVRRSAFLQNAALLTVTSLILRTVGIFFRIYLSNRIGAEGMGLYQLIVSVYVLASAFAAAGICTAVTRMVTDALCHGNRRTALAALRAAVVVSIGVGVASALLVALAAHPISRFCIGDMRAVTALRILTVSLPFMGVSSCLKGYFMARRRVNVTAHAQLLEQAVRIAVIALLLEGGYAVTVAAACAVVMVGDVVAESASCLHLLSAFRRDRRQLPPQNETGVTPVMATLMGIALPITVTRYLNTALHTVENLLVPSRLSRYTGSRAVALAQFGSLKGMAMPLLFFPASFLSSLATLLIPEISEAASLDRQEQVKRAVARTLHLTLTGAVLVGGVFYLYAIPLGQLLYHSDEVGCILRALAPLVPAMYVESMVDGILKGLNQQVSTLKYSLVDSALRLCLVITVVPRAGMAGFLFVMTVSNVLVAVLNVNRLMTVTGMRFRWRQWVVAPTLAVAVAAWGSGTLQRNVLLAACPPIVAVALGILLLCGLFLLLLYGCGCISKQDIAI
ncbi:MAG: hypothetical protein E7552_02945 [Ruminococcaceae bacterium]|nr:hypothetical protein [Oscillospiraceae bacterium]